MATIVINGARIAASYVIAPLNKCKGCCSCSRLTTHWRMIPALAALVTSIMAVVLAIFLQYKILAGIFAVGALGSCYLVYLAYQYGLLASLSEINDNLKMQMEDLNKQCKEYKTNNAQLRKNNQTYSHQNNLLAGQVSTLSTLNSSQKENLQQMEANNTKLQSEIKQIKAHADQLEKEVAELGTHNQDLSGIVKDLKAQIGTLQEVNKGLSDSLVEFEKIFSPLMQKQTLQSSEVEKATGKVKECYEEMIKKMGGAGEIAQGVSTLLGSMRTTLDQFTTITRDLLSKEEYQKNRDEVVALRKEAGDLREATASARATLELLEQQVEQLKKTNLERLTINASLMESGEKLAHLLTKKPSDSAKADP